MKLGYDPQKNARNISDRGLSFDDVPFLNWIKATIRQDRRKDYGEIRFRAFVRDQGNAPYVVVFTLRGETVWVISFRRAHEREGKIYGK